MTLGNALLIIFVLYLIDKHNRWRQAVKTAVTLIVAAAVLWASIMAWSHIRGRVGNSVGTCVQV